MIVTDPAIYLVDSGAHNLVDLISPFRKITKTALAKEEKIKQ